MKRYLVCGLVLAVLALAGVGVPSSAPGPAAEVVAAFELKPAQAHGPHHSPIRPAYDCFKYWNTETRRWHSTEGDYAVTVDLDLDVYILWRCQCIWYQAGQRYVCRWVEKARNPDITKLPKPEGYAPGDQFKVRVREWAWVKWMAYHASTGCVVHYGHRYVLFTRRHGSEG